MPFILRNFAKSFGGLHFHTNICNLPDGKEHTDIINKLENIPKHKINTLVAVLQNRSILDLTTSMGALQRSRGNVHGYANVEGREEIKYNIVDVANVEFIKAMDSEENCSKAFATLFSYQLRDDIDLTGRTLNKDDFAKDAFDRKSAVDWALLERAVNFVDEIEATSLRETAMHKTRVTIRKMQDESTLNNYSLFTNGNLSQQKFQKFLEEEAVKDKNAVPDSAALLAGFYDLNEAQTELFISALERREILDVSKKGFWGSAFGLAERDYADPRGRQELTNRYIKNSLSKGGRLPISSEKRINATRSLLATQMQDDADLTKVQDFSKLNVKDSKLFFARSTMVDWKLFRRALQYVYRTTNEEQQMAQDRELYLSQNNVQKTGDFSFQSDFMRKNLHQTGSRFTRFAGRVGVDYLKDQIPAHLQQLALGLMSPSAANTINALGLVDESGMQENVENTVDDVDIVSGLVQNVAESNLVQILSDSLGTAESLDSHVESIAGINENYIGTANNAIGYFGNVVTIAKSSWQLFESQTTMRDGNKAAKKHTEADDKQTEEAAKNQNEKEKELSDASINRNKKNMSLATGQAQTQIISNYVEEVLVAVTGVACTAVDASNWLGTAIETGIKTARYFTELFAEKKLIEKYFDHDKAESKEVKSMRDNFDKKNGLPNNTNVTLPKKHSELMQEAHGFENSTEYGSFVGLNLVRSLLFCSSKFNPNRETRVQAITTLTALEQKSAIGKCDDESAMNVFNSLLAKAYR